MFLRHLRAGYGLAVGPLCGSLLYREAAYQRIIVAKQLVVGLNIFIHKKSSQVIHSKYTILQSE